VPAHIGEPKMNKNSHAGYQTDLDESRDVSRAAVLGRDYRGVNFELLCKEGDKLRAGAALMRDARRPSIVFTAPVAGTVVRIERGARRKLVSLQLDVEDALGSEHYPFSGAVDKASLRTLMLESGTWTALRRRPFGGIPDPDAEPAALFVTAMDTEPLAPDPASIIENWSEQFRSGVDALVGIVDAPVYVCHAADASPPVDPSGRVSCVAFSGNHPAGLPGVHINSLCPIGFGGGEVWHIGYQDVISLGHLLQTGTTWAERVVAVGGAAVRRPRSLRVAPGASIGELLKGELHGESVRILSGSELCGHAASAGEAYLGARHRQITALIETGDDVAAEQPGALIPSGELEKLAPPGIYPVPMMRALQVGDVDRARELGALELIEQDVALLSLACPMQRNYGQLLRKVLDQLEAAG
jgi:Na+-transporting NADH:ubiquinone oxidoreductase subunit A